MTKVNTYDILHHKITLRKFAAYLCKPACKPVCAHVPACLSAHVTRANANTGGPVCVCPMQTFCECVPGSSQLKHRWSDSESAREAPAKVRPRRHNQTTHSYEPFFSPLTSLVAFFSPRYPDGSAEAYCILNVTFCSRAAVEARPQLSCVRGN